MSVLTALKKTLRSRKTTEEIFGVLIAGQEEAMNLLQDTQFSDKDLAKLVEVMSNRNESAKDDNVVGPIIARTYQPSNDLITKAVYSVRHDMAALDSEDHASAIRLVHMLYSGWDSEHKKHVHSILSQLQIAANELLHHEHYPTFIGPPVLGEH